ncbi:serine/threonine-protein kinase [Enhygromyxa salina]|uniref:Serine/threonine-protein kinase PrkC n=1 Tax=Enhygromyxa salina TaxID=215803 RepID=A0A2S9YU69_9BACT|nr:serine/threonine-protein kinase [Enhygromyxa salina]PRQ08582.1 Serine/threonine-protein kinase PrkC [Enhygromyxa salina]
MCPPSESELSRATRPSHNGLDTPIHGRGLLPPTNPEQRRAIASVRGKLFGEAPVVRVGRYEIERQLGVGGMGEVYLAFDPELERKVALKQVRAELAGGAEQDRLRREARALAQLSHPNVVQVHEVSRAEGETYVAMEYVEGQTLERWLTRPRAWAEILTMLVAAGRGLAAAHSAGVVHRDFKPANVLIGGDGRARVADFGLALASGDPRPRLEVAGTIRYMALEQLRGEAVDARSDQFSFCVTLYEALWGTSPFARGQLELRVEALAADRAIPPPRNVGVPRRLWTLIRRGLRADPDARWGTLDELLEALEGVPRRRQRAAAASLVLPLLGLMAWAGAGLSNPTPLHPCAAVETELASTWGPTHEAELHAAFIGLGPGHGPDSAERVSALLSAWATKWTDARTQQCEANERDGEALARARRACLERQRRRFSILVEGMLEPELATLDRAIEATLALPDPRSCAAASLLDGPLPPTEAQREAVETLRLKLAEATAWRELGHGRLEPVVALERQARELRYRPLLAEVVAELGHTQIAVGSPKRGLELLDAAGKQALAVNHRRLLAQTWTKLALHGLTDLPREDAAQLLELAEATWTELDPDAQTRAWLTFAGAKAAAQAGANETAEAELRALLEREGAEALGPAVLDALAAVASGRQAIELREAALGRAEDLYGPRHPLTARRAYNLGAVLHDRGEFEAARPLLMGAVEIWNAAHDGFALDLARAHLVLADHDMRVGAVDDAEAHAEAVARIHARTLPPDHPEQGDAAMLRSRIMGLRGDRARSQAYAVEALAAYERASGPSDDRVLALRLDVAGNELGLGRIDAATREYEAVLASDPRPKRAALAHVGLAEIALRQAQLERGVQQLAAAELLGVEVLAEQRVAYEIVHALVELRGGCRGCASTLRQSVREAMDAAQWTDEQLAPWLHELELSAVEAAQLGLTIAGVEARGHSTPEPDL